MISKEIETTDYIGNYHLKIVFSDGLEQIVDFRDFDLIFPIMDLYENKLSPTDRDSGKSKLVLSDR